MRTRERTAISRALQQRAMELHRRYGLSYAIIGVRLGMSKTGAAKAVRAQTAREAHASRA